MNFLQISTTSLSAVFAVLPGISTTVQARHRICVIIIEHQEGGKVLFLGSRASIPDRHILVNELGQFSEEYL
ncbi:hypothetical protein KC19_4G054800 [Ceratodon purpureus]|uniref:Secreted protein n=1 Tax=Ceratodon purpureus TaxID=3225 RepID=A0A8T0I6Z1_CERPU|nr:hypothetical protein KC19_4G054800 [Ceratodon purpureus]